MRAHEDACTNKRLDIHGAINLETGQTRMVEAPGADGASTLALPAALEAQYLMMHSTP